MKVVHSGAKIGRWSVGANPLPSRDTLMPPKSVKYTGTQARAYHAKATASRARQAMFASKRGANSRVKRILASSARRGETKTVDTTVTHGSGTGYTLNQTAQITPMNLVQEGSSFYNRIGRRIEMKSLHLHGNIIQTGVGTTVSDYARVLVVYDRQANGATPSFSTIMANYDQAGTSTSTGLSDLNPDEKERFAILADERLVLPAVTAATGLGAPTDSAQRTCFNINRFIKLRGLTTHYKASSSPSVIGDVATGSLLLVTIGTAYASGSEGWEAQLSWRLRYDDK